MTLATPRHPPAAGFIKGSVTLVGAGPGDPELLTLKAVRAIAKATVILVDDLVNEEVLTHAAPSARIVHVGKRGGCQSTPQAFIERLMIAEYHKGESVVRLKGGDPLIFGRAGEEIETLRAAGIQCTVVNGITAALAAATALNLPLTHRDCAQGVVFVTGHPQAGAHPTDWVTLGETALKAKLTLVIYMGVNQAAQIQTSLLVNLPMQTPVALVQNASCKNEVRRTTTLSDLTACLAREQLSSPLVMIIGDVTLATVQRVNCLPVPAMPTAVSPMKDRYNRRLVG